QGLQLRDIGLPAGRRLRHAEISLAQQFAIGLEAGPEAIDLLVGERPVLGGQAEVRRALEDGDLARILGNERRRLDAGRSRADHGDTLAAEVDGFVRPASGDVDLAREILHALDVRLLWNGEAARRHDTEPRLERIAAIRLNAPALAGFVVVCLR